MLASLCACRYTDILVEHLEDPVNGTMDVTVEPEYKESPDAPQDLTKPASTPSKSNNLNQQSNSAPTYSASETMETKTDQRQQEEQSNKEDEATKGKKKSSGEGEAQTTESDGAGDASQNEVEDAPEETDDTKGKSDESDPGDEGEGGDEGTGGKGGKGKVYNDGTYKDLPEDVGSIAATGQYAVIVQMLAGKGGLAACDAVTLKSMKKTGAFEYEDGDPESLDAVDVAWSGDGTKNSSIDVKALVAAEPDVVLTDGATTALNAKQTEELNAAGIDVVSAPRLGTTYTADDDIITAVRLVGQLLKKADTQYNASEMASEYVKLHKTALKDCNNANGGYSYKVIQGRSMPGIYQGKDTSGESTKDLSDVRVYTAFIDSWTNKVASATTASRKFGTSSMYLNGEKMDASEGMGLSAVCSKDNFVLMDYYLQQSGVVDNSFDTAKPVASENANSLPFAIMAGNPENLLSIEYSRRSVPSAMWFSITGSALSSGWTVVGDDVFPALLTRDEEMADKVVASAKKDNGLYNMGQSYGVWVVPSGLAGSWADGTVESFLLAPWAYDMFQGGGKLNSCVTYLEDYCKVFYRSSSYKGVFSNYYTVMTTAGAAADSEEEGGEDADDDSVDQE